MATREVDPISRIEGHLGVTCTTDGSDYITDADVHCNLWRGFENFLVGREINDAITFTQRICGVCPLPHATASMMAVDACFGYSPGYMTFAGTGDSDVPAAAAYIRNLVYASEFVMSAITHFYHLAAPSYVQGPAMPPWTPYFNDADYFPLLRSGGAAVPTTTEGFSADLWSAVIKQYVKALRIRRLTFEAGALFAGRMPMVASFVAGGTTNYFAAGELDEKCNMFYSMFAEIGEFIFKEHVPLTLALGILYPDFDNTDNTHSGATGKGWGAGCGNHLAWGAFPNPATDAPDIQGGYVMANGAPSMFMTAKADLASAITSVETNLEEDVTRARYDAPEAYGYTAGSSAFPGDVTRTVPLRTDPNKYTWAKAPRWMGQPMEVGPLSRMIVNSWYPSTGGTLVGATWNIGGTVASPSNYVSTVVGTLGSYTGLNPALVGADLAVALVREGLAKVQFAGTGVAGTDALVDRALLTALGATFPTLANAYTVSNTYAGGLDFSTYSGAVIANGTLGSYTVVTDLATMKGGLSTMDRLRGRCLESAVLVQLMIGAYDGTTFGGGSGTSASSGWIGGLANTNGTTYPVTPRSNPTDSSGWKCGVSEAPRGALAHFATVENGKIAAYQCVVPTTWNASPKDSAGNMGPIEAAVAGTAMGNSQVLFAGNSADFAGINGTVSAVSGVEALRIAQSFDPCIACCVH